MASSEQPDLLVIGSGSAGFSAAEAARDAGGRVLIVDRDPALAGQCILRGCMPAKAVFHAAEVAHAAETGSQTGVEVEGVHVDTEQVIRRERALVQNFAEYRREQLDGFDVLNGCARFVDENAVDVDGRRIEAAAFVIASGSVLEPPGIPGLSECACLTPETVLQKAVMPRSLVILGAGPVGCEFAHYFARLSTAVTLLQDAAHVLRSEDDDVAAAVADGLREDGVTIEAGVTFERVAREGGRMAVYVRAAGITKRFEADEVLCTIERRPNIRDLGLDAAGIESERGIVVDGTLRSTNPHVYAAGDAIGHRMLVHAAVHCGAVAARNALGKSHEVVNFDLLEAHSIYTDPEVGVTGLCEREAQRRGLRYRVARYNFADHGRAMTEDALNGFVKMLSDEEGRVLGITIVGKAASELIHEALTLLYFRARVDDVTRIPHLHPTLAEILTYPAAELATA